MRKNLWKRGCIGIISISMAFNIIMPVYAEEQIEEESRIITDSNTDQMKESCEENNYNKQILSWDGEIAEGTRCYYNAEGEKVTGLQEIEGFTYYFNEEGTLQTGWQEVEHTAYYFSLETGERYEDKTVVIDDVKYSFDSAGNAVKIMDEENKDAEVAGQGEGTQKEDNEPVREEIGEEKENLLTAEDGRDIEVKAKTGWATENGKKYYVLPNGKRHTGWLSFGKTYYYCGSDGAIVYGKYKVGGNWYYFNEQGIRQQNKWIIENGKKKYYALSDGKLRVGWLSFGSSYYYCRLDAAVAYGKLKIGNDWYYFDEQGVRQQNKWIKEDGEKKYYALPDGKLRVGWLSFGNTYYYCGIDGAIIKNRTCNINGICYYFDEQGIRQKLSAGWKSMGAEKKYYVLPDGTVHTGWLSFGQTYYYCGKDGLILYGKQKIGNNWYYFDKSGIRQQNKWIKEEGANRYYALPDGKLHVGWLSFGSTYYYCRLNAELIKGQVDYPIEGVKYTFDANGVMKKEGGWGSYNGNKYYKNPSTGFPYKNQWVSFGQTYYYANSKGLMVSGWQTIGGYRYYFNPTTKIMARNTTVDGIKIGNNGRVLNYQERMSIFSTVSTNNANGTYNMSRALKSFNQIVIMPGQTLSFFGVAGPCGAAQGYLPGGVVGGVGYGGGICQASTTLYGAALRAGLTIVERNNHSVPSTYVPIGQDAMVDYGSSDLKIRNDYSFPVKIVTYVNGNTLYAEIWGNQPNWYDHVEITSWWTGSNSAIAYRNYIKNGKVVKTEQLSGSFYY